MKPTFPQLSTIAVLLTGSLIAYSELTLANGYNTQPQWLAQNQEYPEIARDSYMQGCGEAVESLFADKTAEFCGCMLEEFEAEFSYQRFLELSQQAEAGQTPPEFSKVGDACAKEVLNTESS